MSGLINFGPSGKFLTESNVTTNSTKCCLIYEKKTHVESLAPGEQLSPSFRTIEIIENLIFSISFTISDNII